MKKVKKVTKVKAFLGRNDEVLKELISGFQQFDQDGNLVKEVQYTNGGDIEIANGYKYDDKNRLIEEIHYYDEEEIGEIVKYKLDEEGRKQAQETVYGDGSVSKTSYTRFENMVTIKTLDEDGDLEAEELIKLDENGKILEEIHFDEDRQIVQKYINSYDKDGNMISRTEFGENEEFIVKVKIEYDNKGNGVMETHFNRKDEVVNQVAFNFDEAGNRTSWENSVYIHKTVFDKEGRPTHDERLNRRNNLVEEFTDYKYDEEGKILEEKSFSMGEQYELELGVVARTKSDFILHRYDYEYFDE